MGTTDRHYLHARDGRVAVFLGSDGMTAYALELYAPAPEIARFAALFAGEIARVEADDRARDRRRDPADPGGLADQIPALTPYLVVSPAGWPAARRLLAEAWGIDIADAPVALHTESKYTIDIMSAAPALLRAARDRALATPVLGQERTGAIHRGSASWDGAVPIDYYNWPAGVDEATHALLLGLGSEVAAEVGAHPSRWAKPARRSAWLYAQHERDHVTPRPEAWALRHWRPDPDAPEAIRHESSRGPALEPLYPADDAGLAAFADHDLTLTFAPWAIPMDGPLATLVAIAQARLARSERPRNDWWTERAVAPTTLAEDTASFAAARALPGFGSTPIARAYLLSREHGFAMLAAFGWALKHTGQRPLEGEALGFAFALSPAQPLPVLPADADDAALVAALDALPWTFAAEAAGADLEPRTIPLLLVEPTVSAKRGVVRFEARLAMGDPAAEAPGGYRRDAPPPTAVLELTDIEDTPRTFTLDPDLGKRTLELALSNLASSMRWYADNITAKREPAIKVNPRRERENLAARLRAQAAAVTAIHDDLPPATWTETPAGFHFAARIPLPGGGELAIARDIALDTSGGQSPTAAREHVQRFFVNGGLRGDLEPALFPDRAEAEDAWHRVVEAITAREVAGRAAGSDR